MTSDAPPYSKASGAVPIFWFSRMGPTTTVFRPASSPKKMNRFKRPLWDRGGLPGGDVPLPVRMLCRAVVRMKAPAFDRFFRLAASADRTTSLGSKNMSKLTVFIRNMTVSSA